MAGSDEVANTSKASGSGDSGVAGGGATPKSTAAAPKPATAAALAAPRPSASSKPTNGKNGANNTASAAIGAKSKVANASINPPKNQTSHTNPSNASNPTNRTSYDTATTAKNAHNAKHEIEIQDSSGSDSDAIEVVDVVRKPPANQGNLGTHANRGNQGNPSNLGNTSSVLYPSSNQSTRNNIQKGQYSYPAPPQLSNNQLNQPRQLNQLNQLNRSNQQPQYQPNQQSQQYRMGQSSLTYPNYGMYPNSSHVTTVGSRSSQYNQFGQNHRLGSNFNNHSNNMRNQFHHNTNNSINSNATNQTNQANQTNANISTGPQLEPEYIEVPSNFTPTWGAILPKTFLQKNTNPNNSSNSNSNSNQAPAYETQPRRLILTLINVWEFTISGEPFDNASGVTNSGYNNGYSGYAGYGGGYGGYGGYGGGGYGHSSYNHYSNYQKQKQKFHQSILTGLRKHIRKISKEHVGQGGRKGAVFDDAGNGGIVPDDPLLREADGNNDSTSNSNNSNNSSNNSSPSSTSAGARWRIPLGAYQPLLTFLTQDKLNIVEIIPPEQLRAATLGRERLTRASKQEYPSPSDLIRRGVSMRIASTLAPYQRAGVEFILEREGRALLADEMGLGKTIQAIAAMSAYRSEWPLLVLCPSTARYHWETEFGTWLGKPKGGGSGSNNSFGDDDAPEAADPSGVSASSGQGKQKVLQQQILHPHQINVLTSGRDPIFPHPSTKVVICSLGLIVNLIASQRITPGMFSAIIVDESHALKSKSTKRTKAVLPILQEAERVLLLSGTPALARPGELWPQLSVLGVRRKDGIHDETSGIWEDETSFMEKYVKGEKGKEDVAKSRLAELHTLLTSTVMIRRMKSDILKNLPTKIREKAYIKIEDEALKDEFRTYMQILRQGRGVLGKLAREDAEAKGGDGGDGGSEDAPQRTALPPGEGGEDGGVKKSREVLHHLYNITGKSKISRVTKMLNRWLADPTKGKLCIFAHHLDVLDGIARGANLSNSKESTRKFIRIDGSTTPKARQDHIQTFQTDPRVRIALLGITAAGVAVTLTASSTVWFAELFWTPAIMIQAEDRCHRIGQQARVRCLYFICKGSLDEVIWKLIEKKFRALGEFVEGKENMGIALERELEDDESDEILKNDEKGKRKATDDVNDIVDPDDALIKEEIAELCHEEEEMLKVKGEDEEEEPENNEKESTSGEKSEESKEAVGGSEKSAISLVDDDDQPMTIAQTREFYRKNGIFAKVRLQRDVLLKDVKIYSLRFPGRNYGLVMVSYNDRVVVKSFDKVKAGVDWEKPEAGSIIIALNGYMIPLDAPFAKILQLMKHFMKNPPVTLTFAEDEEFKSMFMEDVLPGLPSMLNNQNTAPNTTFSANAHSFGNSAILPQASPLPRPQKPGGVIELLDD